MTRYLRQIKLDDMRRYRSDRRRIDNLSAFLAGRLHIDVDDAIFRTLTAEADLFIFIYVVVDTGMIAKSRIFRKSQHRLKHFSALCTDRVFGSALPFDKGNRFVEAEMDFSVFFEGVINTFVSAMVDGIHGAGLSDDLISH